MISSTTHILPVLKSSIFTVIFRDRATSSRPKMAKIHANPKIFKARLPIEPPDGPTVVIRPRRDAS
jgi:hypothetical protein